MKEKIALAKLEKLKRVAYKDLYTFTKNVAGFDLLEPVPHKEVCDFFIKEPDILQWLAMSRAERAKRAQIYGNIKKLIMLPRGAFKSTISTVSFPIWLHWHDPNLRIMINNESYKNSKKFLSEIKAVLSTNELLRKVLVDEQGNFLLEPNDKIPGGWTEDSIIYKHRTIPAKEPSLFCSGVDTAATGMHPDVIIMDDLVSERNVTTEDQIEKVKQHYRFAYSLLEPGGLLIVIGTRYHMNDLYNEILADDTFDHIVRPAILEDGSYFFPTRLGPKRLEELKKSQGIYIFNSQYMLNPISSENAVFRPQDIKYYDDCDLPKKYYTFITVDLAISQKEKADNTVIMVSSVDADSNIYIREIEAGKFTPQDTIDKIFNMVNKYKKDRLLKVGVESVAWQKALIYFLRDQMRARGHFFPLVELKADKDKIRRAHALAPFVENGAFYIKKDMTTLFQEMIEFPLGKHDDHVDAASYIPQIMRKPGKSERKGYDTVYTPINNVTGY